MLTWAAIAALFTMGIAGITLLPNFVRKLLAMNVMQVGVIVFFVALAFKHGASVPILGEPPAEGVAGPAAAAFMNPLPHTLMLTAIVVSVATTGLALGLLVRIRHRFGTLNEDRLLAELRRP